MYYKVQFEDKTWSDWRDPARPLIAKHQANRFGIDDRIITSLIKSQNKLEFISLSSGALRGLRAGLMIRSLSGFRPGQAWRSGCCALETFR